MNIIARHEFIENQREELALVIDAVSLEPPPPDPVFLVSREAAKAYLHRSATDIHEIVDIGPDIIDHLREAALIMVIELIGEKVVHSYEAITGILEEDYENMSDENEIPPPQE